MASLGPQGQCPHRAQRRRRPGAQWGSCLSCHWLIGDFKICNRASKSCFSFSWYFARILDTAAIKSATWLDPAWWHSAGQQKKHICNYCSKAWERPSDLAKHIRVHTGDQPFQCKDCDQRFSDKSLLMKHVRTHNSQKLEFVESVRRNSKFW